MDPVSVAILTAALAFVLLVAVGIALFVLRRRSQRKEKMDEDVRAYFADFDTEPPIGEAKKRNLKQFWRELVTLLSEHGISLDPKQTLRFQKKFYKKVDPEGTAIADHNGWYDLDNATLSISLTTGCPLKQPSFGKTHSKQYNKTKETIIAPHNDSQPQKPTFNATTDMRKK